MVSIVFLLFLSSCKTDQNSNENFYIIEGKVPNSSEKVYLYQALDSSYYLNTFKVDSTLANNGSFSFKIRKKNSYPFPYILIVDKVPTSSFLLEPIDQKITIDTLKFRVKPKITSKFSTLQDEIISYKNANQNRVNELTKYFDSIKNTTLAEAELASLMGIERKKSQTIFDSNLSSFVKEHPNSYNSFWEIVSTLHYSGYSKELDIAYKNLSSSIKNTELGIVLNEDFANKKLLAVGSIFPQIPLRNFDFEKEILDINRYNKSEYILVDFWFSNCGPCIREFPKYHELYSKYGTDTLEIIGVSTDLEKDMQNWHKAIKKYKINWVHFLDKDRVEASKLGISKFPTNFLLNSKGEILEKDITAKKLEAFLVNTKK